MAPFIVLVISIVVFWLAGRAGVGMFHDTGVVLRAALAVMLFLTASAHWGRRRADLIRMVPPSFPRADLLVTVTGILEILGSIGLLVPATGRSACICLAVLLVAMFPANVYAARRRLTIAGQSVPGLAVRTILQVVFIGTLIAAASVR